MTTGPPRAAGRPPLLVEYLAAYSFVLLASLPTLPVALLVGWTIRWRGWRPSLVALAAGLVYVVEVFALGADLARLHVSAWVEYGPGLFDPSPGWTGRVLALWGHRLLVEALAGIPLGVVGGAVLVWRSERDAAGAPWHPATQRRLARLESQDTRRVSREVARADDSRCTGPALAIHRASNGELPEWRQGRYVVLPHRLRGHALLVAGMPDSGKTETLKRLAYDAGARGMKLIFVDCKGTDPQLAAEVLAAYRLGRGEGADPIRLLRWPAGPLDMWRGEPAHVQNRLMALKDYSVPWWTDVAAVALRLALEAPGEPRCSSSRELLRRLDPDWLAEKWAGQPELIDLAAAKANHGLEGVHLRYSGFFNSVGAAFDGGVSFEDLDVLVLTVPTLVARRDAEAAVRVVLEDFGHYASARKPRHGEDVRLMVDEFSAVDGLAEQAAQLKERLRDVRGGVVLAAQSWEGLGSDWNARRLLGADAALILHRMPFPEPFLEAAGHVEVPEQTWQLDEYGSTGTGAVRMRMRPLVDPQQVRHAGAGEAWLVQPGEALRMQVLQVPTELAAVQARQVLDGAPSWVARPPWVVDLAGAADRPGAGQEGARRPLPGAGRPELPPPVGAPVPAIPTAAGGGGSRLRLQLAAAVREGDTDRALALVEVGGVDAAELQQLQATWRLARLPLLVRWLLAAGRTLLTLRRSNL